MILIDANLLIYAKFSDLPQHARARKWFVERLNAPGRSGIPWQSGLAFLRLSTNPRLFDQGLSIADAWSQLSEWLNHPRVWIPEPTSDHQSVLGQLLLEIGSGANLVPDAHLAALAIEHGLVLCSADADFGKFPGLQWRNPLRGES